MRCPVWAGMTARRQTDSVYGMLRIGIQGCNSKILLDFFSQFANLLRKQDITFPFSGPPAVNGVKADLSMGRTHEQS